MVVTLTPTYTVSVGDIEMVAIDYTRHLDESETLTGTPTAVLVGSGTLTIANVGLNASTREILGRDVAANCAVQFKISGQATGVTYTIRVTATTNGTPARTVVRDVKIVCS